MPTYTVNADALKHARALIDAGDYDSETDWSDAAPDTDRSNEVLDKQGWDTYSIWHLAVDPDSSEETKKRYHFPYGDFETVNRAALIHGKQRASQNDHSNIERAFDELLQHLDSKRDS